MRPGFRLKGVENQNKQIKVQIASTGWIMVDRNMRTTNSQTNRGLLRRMRRFRLLRWVTIGLILPAGQPASVSLGESGISCAIIVR